jgi:hypothetical protein
MHAKVSTQKWFHSPHIPLLPALTLHPVPKTIIMRVIELACPPKLHSLLSITFKAAIGKPLVPRRLPYTMTRVVCQPFHCLTHFRFVDKTIGSIFDALVKPTFCVAEIRVCCPRIHIRVCVWASSHALCRDVSRLLVGQELVNVGYWGHFFLEGHWGGLGGGEGGGV